MKIKLSSYINILFLTISTALTAQSKVTRRVTGMVVSDSLATPVAFAFVANSKTGIGKETNDDGLFTLNMEPGDTLLFRCMGYEDNSWPLQELNSRSDTLILQVTSKSYALDEINVLQFRSYAAFRHKVAHMKDMYHNYNIPFQFNVGAALAEKKAESGTFGTSIRIGGKGQSRKKQQYIALLAREKTYERYNTLTSRENLKAFTNLDKEKLDSFIVFLRSKHNINPALNDYDLMTAINDVFEKFMAMRTDSIQSKP